MNFCHIIFFIIISTQYTDAVRIGIPQIAKTVKEALTQLTPVLENGTHIIEKLEGYQNGSWNINVQGEISTLPNAIKYISIALNQIRTDFNNIIEIFDKEVNATSVSSPAISVPVAQIEPYLINYKNISKSIAILATNIQVISNIILNIALPEIEMSSSSNSGLYISQYTARQYLGVINILSGEITKLANVLKVVVKESAAGQSSKESGIAIIALNTINGICKGLSKEFLIFSKKINTFTTTVTDISSNTKYINVKGTLIKLNLSLVQLNGIIKKAHGWFKSILFLVKLITGGQLF